MVTDAEIPELFDINKKLCPDFRAAKGEHVLLCNQNAGAEASEDVVANTN
jgi:hypothetical protein